MGKELKEAPKIQDPTYSKPITTKEEDDEYPTFDSHAHRQAPKLAAMLTLSLADTVGVQQSIITDELEDDEDGIAAWAALITHFEYSTEDIKAEVLFHKWEEESLGCGEHPEVLWARLSSLQRKLAKLGEECNNKNLMRRFISAIDKQPGHIYGEVLASYRGQLIMGRPYTSTELREFLSITYKKSSQNDINKAQEGMKGFIATETCSYCSKRGHAVNTCWLKDPSKKPEALKTRVPKYKNVKYYNYGKSGHIKKDCRAKNNQELGIAAAIVGSANELNSKPIYIDSACSCHIVASLHYLHNTREVKATVTAVGGQHIDLTHKGTALINTNDGPLSLHEVFYAELLPYGLISVPQLAKRGVTLHLSNERAYLMKGGSRINLSKKDWLWTLPEFPPKIVANLRMEMSSSTNSNVWHQR